MLQQLRRTYAIGLCLLIALVATPDVLHAQTPTAVPTLDTTLFTGTWYEIARYPDKHEKNCVGNVILVVSRADKPHRLQWVQACTTKKGYTDDRNVNAKPQQKNATDGRLKTGSFWPFYTKFWVLALGSDYDWALVGNPNHKNLWVLSRTALMKPEVLADIRSKAAAQGFDPAKLVPTPQTRSDAITPPTPAPTAAAPSPTSSPQP